MKEQELILTLFKELLNSVEELHEEYSDDNISYVIDKDGNTLSISFTLEEENKDKKDFENFVNGLDDDIYQETLESLGYGISDLAKIYDSENYQEVIDCFKNKVKEIATEKMEYLKTLI